LKKIFIVFILFVAVLFTAHAQKFYFDIGLGVGGAWTKLDDIDISDTFKSANINFKEVGVDLGLKAGFRPSARLPFYIALVFGGMGHRLDYIRDYFQFNSYLIGPGLIFYPVQSIQLAGSIGYSFVGNQPSLPVYMLKSDSGFAGDVSIAADLGKTNHGLLIGLRYFGARNTINISRTRQNSSGLSVFLRYAFRNKF